MKSSASTAAVLFAFLFSTRPLTMAQQSQTTTKQAAAQTVSEPSGEYLFNTYCAVCHGKDGKGAGPAAGELKVPPPDLTTLSKRHGGKFPTEYVSSVLHYGISDLKAHGSPDMPIWGELFAPSGALTRNPSRPLAEEREVDAARARKIQNLTQYIESLQAK
ncbi:MAG TPA: c-type cytochrome [Candidatus Acidoferrum sp.]|nr:c-type cytochrome [Candidatus Acidoferrum sp.]